MYSGYVDLDNTTKKIHYLLVESQNDPANDPLVVWFNGGPGCSSMLGWMQEHGPNSYPNGGNAWVKNEYSWNKEANVLYIEQPAGVGFSMCDWDNHPEDCTFDDNSMAKDNLEAILKWYQKYPEYEQHELYISGESYGGIYVPFTAHQIYLHNEAARDDPSAFKPNLQGFLVGNGCTNWKVDTTPAYLEMGFWHSLYDTATYDSMKALGCDYSMGAKSTEICDTLIEKFNNDTAQVNVYDIFGHCYTDTEGTKPGDVGVSVVNGKIKTYKKVFTPEDYTPWAFTHKKKSANLKETPPCVMGKPLIEYMNRQDVRQALHIPDDIHAWDMCNSDTFRYSTLPRGS